LARAWNQAIIEAMEPVIEINCLDVWRALSEYIDDNVDPELRARMEAHFKICEHCTALLDGTRNVVRLVGDGQAFDVPSGFSARLKKRLEEA
jgi:anti-sigma factor RsiW